MEEREGWKREKEEVGRQAGRQVDNEIIDKTRMVEYEVHQKKIDIISYEPKTY